MNKKMLAAVAASIIPWFTGCGGGGDPAPLAAATVAPSVAQPQTVLIEAYGDSTMWGFDSSIGEQTPQNVPTITQKNLRGIYGTVVTIANEGVGATTLGYLMGGTDGHHLPWEQQMANSKANIVLVNHGINDSLVGPGETPDGYRALLVRFVTVARASGKTPVFDEPNPTCDTLHDTLPDYVAVMRDVGQKMGVTVIPQFDYIKSLPGWQGYLKDCIHPNAALYEIEAQRVSLALKPFVANLLR